MEEHQLTNRYFYSFYLYICTCLSLCRSMCINYYAVSCYVSFNVVFHIFFINKIASVVLLDISMVFCVCAIIDGLLALCANFEI